MIPGEAIDHAALADHLRELADGIDDGSVSVTRAADALEATGDDPLEATLEVSYIPPESRPDLLVALELDASRFETSGLDAGDPGDVGPDDRLDLPDFE